jgi:23S rRNA (guanosine2251-2'-O)-methyltransferase
VKSEDVWIWGRHPVLEALRAGRARSVLVATGRKQAAVLEEIVADARQQGVPLREASPVEVDAVAPGANTQGVAALVETPHLDSMDDLLALTRQREEDAFILILDQVQDPHNFGALLRTAEAAGVQAVVVPDRRSAPLSGTVAKTSAGALSHLPILKVNNLTRALEELKQSGIWAIGLDAAARMSLFEADLAIPLGLVIGGEGEGLRRLTRDHCDLLVRLPMHGSITSLNASVAGSIALYEGVRQRAGRAG